MLLIRKIKNCVFAGTALKYLFALYAGAREAIIAAASRGEAFSTNGENVNRKLIIAIFRNRR